MQETQVRSLGQEDPLEKEMETHSNILALKIPWTEEPGRLQSMGLLRVIQGEATLSTCTENSQPPATSPGHQPPAPATHEGKGR